MGVTDVKDQADEAMALARELDDPALLARALNAYGFVAVQNAEEAEPYFTEALGLARALGDPWRLSQILAWQAYAAFATGDPVATRVAAEEGRDLADTIGDRLDSRQCRYWLAMAQLNQGDPTGAAEQFRVINDEAEAENDLIYTGIRPCGPGFRAGVARRCRRGSVRGRRVPRGRVGAGRVHCGPWPLGVGGRGPGGR